MRIEFVCVLNFYKIQQYFYHRLRSRSAKSFHSPYLFDLFTKTLADERHFYLYDELAVLIETCANSDRVLPIIDYGAGSQVNNSTNRTLRSITKSVRRPLWQYRWLFLLMQHIQPEHVLELGTSLGFSTIALAKGALHSTIHTLEGAPALVQQARQHFDWAELTNIQPYEGPFVATLPERLTGDTVYDFVMLDGHHTESATIDYFNQILPHCSDNAILWVDDIYWSKGMTRAWQCLQLDPRINISIDVFDFGLLFLRPGKEKEHFILRGGK